MHRISPEEKLLRLIKGAASRKDKPEGPSAQFQPAAQEEPEEDSRVAGSPNFFGLRAMRFFERLLRFESLNRVLRILLVLIVIAFIFDIAYSSSRMQRMLDQNAQSQIGAEMAILPRTLDKEFSYYAAEADLRDIFTSSRRAGDSLAANRVASRQEYVSSLKLLGIISGAKPQAIIEDQPEQRSYSVTVGDYLKDFLVEEVAPGRVRLDYKGAKFDLFL